MLKSKYWIFLFTSYSLYALTTLTVTQSSDNNPGGRGEIGDLRHCLNTMNENLTTTFDDYAILFDFPMTITLNGILPIINNSPNPVNITIGNTGSLPTVIIDGNNAYSGFFIPIGNVTIQNMTFQNLLAKGGNGGDGISGGGGGMGAGGAIYTPRSFLNGSNPAVTLLNVSINNCSAVGGNGGNALGDTSTGDEGGGGGGGFSGNGGSITTTGITGGAGGGGFGGDGGGGGALGGAIFVDSNLNFTLKALSGILTIFNTSNNTTQAGTGGTGGPGGATNGFDGSALGNSIFLRGNSTLTCLASDTGDLLTLGDQVSFTDDTNFGAGNTNVLITGNGTVIYNGTTDYQGTIKVNNANFKVNGSITTAPISVCRNISLSSQRGTLSGNGILSGNVFVNSGTISPDTGGTLTLGNLTLNPADPISSTLGSLVHIDINASGTSVSRRYWSCNISWHLGDQLKIPMLLLGHTPFLLQLALQAPLIRSHLQEQPRIIHSLISQLAVLRMYN